MAKFIALLTFSQLVASVATGGQEHFEYESDSKKTEYPVSCSTNHNSSDVPDCEELLRQSEW